MDAPECRFCLLEENECDAPLIAPCRCKGSSKWVHRSCLDTWRSSGGIESFSNCATCSFEYVLIDISDPVAEETRQASMYRLALTRNTVTFVLSVEVIVAFLYVILYFGNIHISSIRWLAEAIGWPISYILMAHVSFSAVVGGITAIVPGMLMIALCGDEEIARLRLPLCSVYTYEDWMSENPMVAITIFILVGTVATVAIGWLYVRLQSRRDVEMEFSRNLSNLFVVQDLQHLEEEIEQQYKEVQRTSTMRTRPRKYTYGNGGLRPVRRVAPYTRMRVGVSRRLRSAV
jgi:hypothetical protein